VAYRNDLYRHMAVTVPRVASWSYPFSENRDRHAEREIQPGNLAQYLLERRLAREVASSGL